MRNQLLRDSDVMSMAWGLELRVPFVDSKMIETVARIPAQLRLVAGKQIVLDAVPEIPQWVREQAEAGIRISIQRLDLGRMAGCFSPDREIKSRAIEELVSNVVSVRSRELS